MALSPLYIAGSNLQDYLVDKTTGQPLAGGRIYSFKTDGITPKPLFQLTGNNFVPLQNPILVSEAGTPQDSSGNNIKIYYYPYDADENIELYTIIVKDPLGLPQFTLSQFPPNVVAQNVPVTAEPAPIPSYLIGWDFATNPAQFLGPSLGPQATGGNKGSFYAWDQTIVFQNTTNGVTINQGYNGEFIITAALANVQAAIIQYLDGTIVNEILNNNLCVGVSTKLTSTLASIQGNVSLWWGNGDVTSQLATGNFTSIVNTLNPATGYPTVINPTIGGSWSEIPNPNGAAQFNVLPSTNTNFNFNGFSGWSLGGTEATQNATLFAIVIGFGQMNQGDTISIAFASCGPGNIPGPPIYKTPSQVLLECSNTYCKSFSTALPPAQGAGNANVQAFLSTSTGVTEGFSPTISFPVEMEYPPKITIYNPAAANANIRNFTTNADTTNAQTQFFNTKGFSVNFNGDASCAVGNLLGFHWSADIRRGVAGTYTVNYMVVAGGGGGGMYSGGYSGGGGGGGGVLIGEVIVGPGSIYSVIVGAGGTGGTGAGPLAGYLGSNGGNSSFFSFIALGGGGGGGGTFLALPGGSGGGGMGWTKDIAGGLGSQGQGNNGGSGITNANSYSGGGGGGYQAVGGAASLSQGGNGGIGYTLPVTTQVYGSGGGGGASSLLVGGNGGTNAGNGSNGGVATAGTANYGGGGGGNSGGIDAAAGGSGVVIIYYLSPIQRGTGGNVSQSGGYFIHTFLASAQYTA